MSYFNLSIILVASIGYLYFFNTLILPFKIWGFLSIILSTVLCGAIMEQKNWVRIAEYLRILVAVVGLNILYHQSFIKLVLYNACIINNTFNIFFKLVYIKCIF